MRRAFQDMYAKYFDYKGKVSIIGHNMGAKVAYDILALDKSAKLGFKVDCFYTIGGSLSLF